MQQCVPVTAPEDESAPAPPTIRRSSGARTIALTAASHLALPLSAVATGPVLARALGPDGRGELAAVLAPIYLAALLATAGLPEAATFLVASGRRAARATAAAAATMAGGLGALAALAVVLAAPVLLRGSPENIPLLRTLALLLPLSLAGLALRGVVHGRSDFASMNAERWGSVLSRLVLIVALALAGALTVSSAAWATNATALLAAGYLLWRARRLWRGEPGTERPSGTERSGLPWSALVRYGLRVWAGSLSVLLILRVDQVLMAPLAPTAQLGFYAVAVAVAELPAAAFNAVRDVVFATSAARADPHVVARACRTAMALLAPGCLALVVVAPPVVVVFFGQDFAPAVPMVRVLFVAAIPSGLAAVAGAGLMALDRPGRLGVAQAVVAVVNVGVVVALVPVLGGMGAALASLVAYTLLALAAVVLFTRASGLGLREVLVPRVADVSGLVARLRPRAARSKT